MAEMRLKLAYNIHTIRSIRQTYGYYSVLFSEYIDVLHFGNNPWCPILCCGLNWSCAAILITNIIYVDRDMIPDFRRLVEQ